MGPLEGGIKWPTAEHWPGQIVPSAPADDYSCMHGGKVYSRLTSPQPRVCPASAAGLW